MVAFQTLLLGIILGRVPIRVMVTPPVATAVIRLDGAAIGMLTGPPWALDYDFGTSPLPHELIAVGLDAAGHPVGKAVQWVNLGHQDAEVSVVLERGPATGRPDRGRIAWNSVIANQPSAVSATLDGVPLTVSGLHLVPLPETDHTTTHLLSVEVTFSDTLHERADIAFGGEAIDTTESELTALAVIVPPGTTTIGLDALRHPFTVDGAPQDPVAVETGPAEVALVFDEAVRWANPFRNYGFPRYLSTPPRLRADTDRFFAVATVPVRRRDVDGRWMNLYPRSAPMRLSWMRDFTVLCGLTFLTRHNRPQALPTAVAVAGADAAASGHRRAVVLMLAEQPGTGSTEAPGETPPGTAHDATMLTIDAVKAYLTALDVPLVVWSLTGPNPGPLTAAWGPAGDVSSGRRLRKAYRKLDARLARQRIVWFAGRHLPQRITLATTKTPLRLAR
jgi:hypothetical protein